MRQETPSETKNIKTKSISVKCQQLLDTAVGVDFLKTLSDIDFSICWFR